MPSQNTTPRLWAIGDIHGDYDGYHRLLRNMEADGLDLTADTVVFLGDMIDGYPHSKEVVASIRALQYLYGDRIVALRGNHEQLLLDALPEPMWSGQFQLWWRQGGAATYESYMLTQPGWDGTSYSGHQYLQMNEAMKSDVEWFNTLPLTYETDDYIFVHAGLTPGETIETTDDIDKLWIRDEFIDSDHDWGKVIVFGHTAFEKPLLHTNKIGLDTRWRGRGYVSGAELTNGVRFYRG